MARKLKKGRRKLERIKKKMKVKDYLAQLERKTFEARNCYVCKEPIKHSTDCQGIGKGLYRHKKTTCKPGGYYYMQNLELRKTYLKLFLNDVSQFLRKPKKNVKVGKIAKLIGFLKEGKYTLEELVEMSGATINTVKSSISYHFKKRGIIVVKEELKRDGKKVIIFKIKEA